MHVIATPWGGRLFKRLLCNVVPGGETYWPGTKRGKQVRRFLIDRVATVVPMIPTEHRVRARLVGVTRLDLSGIDGSEFSLNDCRPKRERGPSKRLTAVFGISPHLGRRRPGEFLRGSVTTTVTFHSSQLENIQHGRSSGS